MIATARVNLPLASPGDAPSGRAQVTINMAADGSKRARMAPGQAGGGSNVLQIASAAGKPAHPGAGKAGGKGGAKAGGASAWTGQLVQAKRGGGKGKSSYPRLMVAGACACSTGLPFVRVVKVLVEQPDAAASPEGKGKAGAKLQAGGAALEQGVLTEAVRTALKLTTAATEPSPTGEPAAPAKPGNRSVSSPATGPQQSDSVKAAPTASVVQDGQAAAALHIKATKPGQTQAKPGQIQATPAQSRARPALEQIAVASDPAQPAKSAKIAVGPIMSASKKAQTATVPRVKPSAKGAPPAGSPEQADSQQPVRRAVAEGQPEAAGQAGRVGKAAGPAGGDSLTAVEHAQVADQGLTTVRQAGAVQTGGTTRAEAAEQSPAEQVARALQPEVLRTGGRVTIRLNPPELGRVRATLHSEGPRQLRAVLEVDGPRALGELQRQTSVLVQRLADSGILLRRVDFIVGEQQTAEGGVDAGWHPQTADGQRHQAAGQQGGTDAAQAGDGDADVNSSPGRGGELPDGSVTDETINFWI